MEELVIKKFNDKEYLQITEYVLDEKKYYIYFDIETQSKVLICDSNQEIVTDEKILNELRTERDKILKDLNL